MTAARDRLIGTWRLVNWLWIGDDGKQAEPMGPGTQGLITYTADGFMFASLMGANRKPFAGTNPFGGSPAETHAAMSTGLSYCARWRLDGERLVHTIEQSMFPNWVGTEMLRTCRFVGEHAEIATAPVVIDGASGFFKLVLKRAA
jgi:hypothetical protein